MYHLIILILNEDIRIMNGLNLPEYRHRIITEAGQQKIFDIIRKKYVMLTPEEWVRQNFIQYLIQEKSVPASHIAVEAGFKLHSLTKRFDILVFGKAGLPAMLVECKAPNVVIHQETFDQISRYNLALNVKFLVVTNGMDHYCCLVDHETGTIRFLNEIPVYSSIASVNT